MEWIVPQTHEDDIAGKGSDALHHYKFGIQIHSYASSNEDTCSESSSGQRMEKTKEHFGVVTGESQKQI